MLEIVPPPPDTETDTVPRLVTLQEAAAALGVSVRTIRRRVKDGELMSAMVDGRRMVSLPDGSHESSDNTPLSPGVSPSVAAPGPDNPASMSPLLSQLEARIADLEVDRDRARQDADRWHAMSQDLSQRLSEVTGTLYRLTEAKALTPGPEPQNPPRAPWWAFWRR